MRKCGKNKKNKSLAMVEKQRWPLCQVITDIAEPLSAADANKKPQFIYNYNRHYEFPHQIWYTNFPITNLVLLRASLAKRTLHTLHTHEHKPFTIAQNRFNGALCINAISNDVKTDIFAIYRFADISHVNRKLSTRIHCTRHNCV